MKKSLAILLALLVVDRLLKVLVTVSAPIWLVDGLVLGPVYNNRLVGAGLLSHNILDEYMSLIMPVAYLVTIVSLARAIERHPERRGSASLLVLATGLVSNAVDTLIYPGVVDPIGIRLAGRLFVAVNVADGLILAGTIALAVVAGEELALRVFRTTARATA